MLTHIYARSHTQGDLLAQENAITALWNAMIDSAEVIKDVNRLNGEQMMILQLKSGTPLSKVPIHTCIYISILYIHIYTYKHTYIDIHT